VLLSYFLLKVKLQYCIT